MRLFFLLTLCLGIGCIGVRSAASQQTLNLLTVDNFSPFAWEDHHKAKGIDVDVVEEMCLRMGVECNIGFYPWKRVLSYTETGACDGAFTAFKNPTREAFAYFLKYPLHYSTYRVFVINGNEFPFNRIEDLYEKTIGINRGFKLSKEFDEAASSRKIHVDEVNDTEANIKKLMLGRVDGIAANYHEALIILKNMGLSNRIIALSHPIVSPKGAYLMISKKASIPNKKQLIGRMNQTLKYMYGDGTIDRINARYLR